MAGARESALARDGGGDARPAKGGGEGTLAWKYTVRELMDHPLGKFRCELNDGAAHAVLNLGDAPSVCGLMKPRSCLVGLDPNPAAPSQYPSRALRILSDRARP